MDERPDLLTQMLLAEKTEDGEVIIARSPTFVISMQQQIFNWRLFITTPEDHQYGYKHGFCYFGTGLISALRAFKAGWEWSEDPDPLNTLPAGYDKQAF